MSQLPRHSDPRLQTGPTDSARPTLLRAASDHKTNLIDIAIDPLVAGRQILPLQQVRLDIESEHTLRLVPVPARSPWVSRLTAVLLIGCLGFMIYAGAQGILLGIERHNRTSIVMWSCFAGFPAVVLIGFLLSPLFKAGPVTFKFDKQNNLLTLERCSGFNKQSQLVATYSLDDALALQLLYRHYKAFCAGFNMPGKSSQYEMNLVFRDGRQQRVNLAVHSDWRWMRQAGMRLSEFLDVTLVDQLCHD
jgi:hypothetical protein